MPIRWVNPWIALRDQRLGRPNKETTPERAYRLACASAKIPTVEQMFVGRLRPDFYHQHWTLIVEIDGPLHMTPSGIIKDFRRDAALRKAVDQHTGQHFQVLHLDWRLVLTNPDQALALVRHYVATGYGGLRYASFPDGGFSARYVALPGRPDPGDPLVRRTPTPRKGRKRP